MEHRAQRNPQRAGFVSSACSVVQWGGRVAVTRRCYRTAGNRAGQADRSGAKKTKGEEGKRSQGRGPTSAGPAGPPYFATLVVELARNGRPVRWLMPTFLPLGMSQGLPEAGLFPFLQKK